MIATVNVTLRNFFNNNLCLYEQGIPRRWLGWPHHWHQFYQAGHLFKKNYFTRFLHYWSHLHQLKQCALGRIIAAENDAESDMMSLTVHASDDTMRDLKVSSEVLAQFDESIITESDVLNRFGDQDIEFIIWGCIVENICERDEKWRTKRLWKCHKHRVYFIQSTKLFVVWNW